MRSHNRKRFRLGGWVAGAVLLLGPLVVGEANPVTAGPIRARRAPASAREMQKWDAYYQAALSQRRMRIAVPMFLRALSAENGLLPDSAFVHYLRWRRGLNARQFDQFHPRIGPMLEMDLLIRNRIPQPPEIPRTPQIGGETIRPPTEPPPCDGPNCVPEPSSVLTALALIGAAAWWRWPSRRRA